MTFDPLGQSLDDQQDTELVGVLLAELNREIAAMSTIIPDALVRQWETSPVPKPREDTSQRASGDRSNPTADIVFDSRRLAVRDSIRRAENLIRGVTAALRESRLTMETAVVRYDGDGG